MERKSIEALRAMVCGELEDIAKKGTLTHETLDILKDLLQSMHYLDKIDEKEMEQEELRMGGYSQRSSGRYYIDGEYGRGYGSYADGNSYARGGRGGLYNRGGSYMDGNSYMYYDPRMDYPMYPRAGGYSRTGSKREMIEELKDMMKDTGDESIRAAISEAINKLDK